MPVEIHLSPKLAKPVPLWVQHAKPVWIPFSTAANATFSTPPKNSWFVGVYDSNDHREVGVYQRTDNDAFANGITVWSGVSHWSTEPQKKGMTFTWWQPLPAMDTLPPLPLPDTTPPKVSDEVKIVVSQKELVNYWLGKTVAMNSSDFGVVGIDKHPVMPDAWVVTLKQKSSW